MKKRAGFAELDATKVQLSTTREQLAAERMAAEFSIADHQRTLDEMRTLREIAKELAEACKRAMPICQPHSVCIQLEAALDKARAAGL